MKSRNVLMLTASVLLPIVIGTTIYWTALNAILFAADKSEWIRLCTSDGNLCEVVKPGLKS